MFLKPRQSQPQDVYKVYTYKKKIEKKKKRVYRWLGWLGSLIFS